MRYVATHRVRRDITVILAGTYRLQHRHSTYNTTRFERVAGWMGGGAGREVGRRMPGEMPGADYYRDYHNYDNYVTFAFAI